jgi:hypothetical protein
MAKWADYLISEVHYYNDEFISQLKVHEDLGDTVGQANVWDREKVVYSINNGTSFCTILKNSEGKWNKGADVHVVFVNGKYYLRTDKNNTARDNLGNLPEF